MKQSILTKQMYELRKRARYTQEEVSHKLNIQRQTYCNYENATRTPPIEVVVALAELYHVSVDYMVRGPKPNSQVPLAPCEKKLLTEYSALTEGSQKDVMNFIQFKKQYPS